MIRRIEALNYRCLRDVAQDMAPFQILVGPNASGKSAFLDVVAFLGDLLREGPHAAVTGRSATAKDLCWRRLGDRFELAVELRLPPEVRDRLRQRYDRCRYHVAVGEGATPEEVRLVFESFALGEQRATVQQAPSLFGSESGEPMSRERLAHATPSDGWRWVVRRTEESTEDEFRAEDPHVDRDDKFALGRGRSALANLPEDEILYPAATWAKGVLRERVQWITSESTKGTGPAGLQWEPLLPDGLNLPAAVQLLRKDERRFTSWIEHVRSVIPDLEDVRDMTVEERPLTVIVKYRELTLPGWLVSDGTLRLLALTVLAYTPMRHAVCLIEEPETGIHPRAIEAVFQSMSSVYDGQVLAATHSPILVGLARPDDLLCFSRSEEGATAIVPGREHPRLRHWKEGVDLSELYAAGVLG